MLIAACAQPLRVAHTAATKTNPVTVAIVDAWLFRTRGPGAYAFAIGTLRVRAANLGAGLGFAFITAPTQMALALPVRATFSVEPARSTGLAQWRNFQC